MFKNRLRVLRAERGVSQLDTATAAKIPTHRYWLIENGYREPNAAERRAIARVLRTRIGEAFPRQRSSSEAVA